MRVSVALRAIDRSITRPCWRRSSGTKPMPGAHRGERAAPAAGGAVDLDVAGVGAVDAEDRAARPRCGRRRRGPASATISPARTSKLTSKNTPSRVRRWTSAPARRSAASCLGNSAPSSRPTMRRTISSGVMSAIGASCTTAPSRITVTVSQIAKTSSRRCEMNSTAAPCSRSVRTTREQPLDLAARQRGGRLVHDQHARVEAQRLGDLDDLLVGDRQAAHRPVGVEPDAQAVEQPLDLRGASRGGRSGRSARERVAAHHDVLRDATGRGRASAPGR